MFNYGKNAAIAQTTKGKVQGMELNGISIFKGIPYAKAKRFHKPEPVEAWEGLFNATSYGFVCPLMTAEVPSGEMRVPHRYWPQNENCQNLNVWTPGLDNKKRPVMVWLHGGGFFAGSSIEQIAYDGWNMADRGDVVVVTINHRLNVLGYFNLAAYGEEYENSGNAGGDDIIAALQWVHDNIENFGGDPANVTVFGQSGGGMKVTTLLQSPAADGLFAKGYVMSGVAAMHSCKGTGNELAEAVLKELNCTAKELEDVPYADLCAAYTKVSPALAAEGYYTGNSPYPNKYFVGDPSEVGFRKETENVPLMVGSVYGEFLSFMDPVYDRNTMSKEEQFAMVASVFGEEKTKKLQKGFELAYPERNFIDILKIDCAFRIPEVDYIALRSNCPGPVYSYMFNYDFKINGGNTPWHCSDIPYVFANTKLVEYTQDGEASEKLEEQIFNTVMAFAKTGNPNNPSIPEWPASLPGTENTILLDENTRVVPNHDHVLLDTVRKEVPDLADMRKLLAGVKIEH